MRIGYYPETAPLVGNGVTILNCTSPAQAKPNERLSPQYFTPWDSKERRILVIVDIPLWPAKGNC